MATTENAATRRKTAEPDSATNQERELDDALEDTFPASDPVTIGQPTSDEAPRAPVGRRTPLLDVELIKRLARNLKRPARP
jgi:hypothetical protein